jgi:hypothetical protein
MHNWQSAEVKLNIGRQFNEQEAKKAMPTQIGAL